MSDKQTTGTLTLPQKTAAEQPAAEEDSRLATGFGPQLNAGPIATDRLSGDVRSQKDPGTDHRNANQDPRAVTEDRNISEAERLEMFRMASFQFALPDLPSIPGFHLCWCTTTNPRDSIQMRIRMGYQLVRQEDIPGFDGMILKGGEYPGCVGVNEMIAMKLPLSLYELFMTEAHHNQPHFEQDKLNFALEEAVIAARQAKARIEQEGGTAALAHKVKAPRFVDQSGRESYVSTIPLTTIQR